MAAACSRRASDQGTNRSVGALSSKGLSAGHGHARKSTLGQLGKQAWAWKPLRLATASRSRSLRAWRHQARVRSWLMKADRSGSPGHGSPASGARGSGPWPPSAPERSPARHPLQGINSLIGGPFGLVLVDGHHQQIDIRKAIPIAPGQGAVAGGFCSGVQPDAAIVGPQGVVQALAQRGDPPLPLPAAPGCEGAIRCGR